MTHKKDKELKPCHVCGGKARRIGYRDGSSEAECDNSGCIFYAIAMDPDAWNALPRPSSPSGEVVREACELIEFLQHGEFYVYDEEVAGISARDYDDKARNMLDRARSFLQHHSPKDVMK